MLRLNSDVCWQCAGDTPETKRYAQQGAWFCPVAMTVLKSEKVNGSDYYYRMQCPYRLEHLLLRDQRHKEKRDG